ncbi:MAG: DUF3341 domain-containing protein [Cytophagales bacterium]|nr:DUF3341 domain-containing protein [Cytophagales bacterium]
MDLGKKYIVGVFDDDGVLLKGVKQVRSKGVNIEEVYTPFPVHHLEDALGYKRSRLPIVSFLFGITGTTLALILQISMMVVDWPMIIGGKPFFAYPDFVPVAFELSVLLAAYGMVGTFFVRSDLKPHAKPRIFDLRSTDDVHIMAIDLAANSLSEEEISVILKESGAVEVNNKEFED